MYIMNNNSKFKGTALALLVASASSLAGPGTSTTSSTPTSSSSYYMYEYTVNPNDAGATRTPFFADAGGGAAAATDVSHVNEQQQVQQLRQNYAFEESFMVQQQQQQQQQQDVVNAASNGVVENNKNDNNNNNNNNAVRDPYAEALKLYQQQAPAVVVEAPPAPAHATEAPLYEAVVEPAPPAATTAFFVDQPVEEQNSKVIQELTARMNSAISASEETSFGKSYMDIVSKSTQANSAGTAANAAFLEAITKPTTTSSIQNYNIVATSPAVEFATPEPVVEVTPEPVMTTIPQVHQPQPQYASRSTANVADVAVSVVSTIKKSKPFFAAFAPRPPHTMPKDSSKSRIQRIMEHVSNTNARSRGGTTSTSFASFRQTEANWLHGINADQPFTYDSSLQQEIHNGIMPQSHHFVSDDVMYGNPQSWAKLRSSQPLEYDAVVCGGKLGIFFATALAICGHNVCVVADGKEMLVSQDEEWNISLDELEELIRIGILTTADVEASVTTPSFRANPKKDDGFWEGFFNTANAGATNLSVSSHILLDRVKRRFWALGGDIKEHTQLQGIVVSEHIGAALDLGIDQEPLTARLVLDCMGHTSPISKQQRYGKKPDGVCAVVGSCASGYDTNVNTVGDIISTNGDTNNSGKFGQLQYFWEAFPDGKEPGTSDTKTTYTFTYFGANEKRPSLTTLMDDYLDTLPNYQNSISDAEDDLEFKNVHFSYFPTYKDSALKPEWSRVLAVGDASGIQSPLSFGGFGSLTRQLGRITGAVSDALESNLLHKDDLSEINAYQPNLSAAWMFQKAMSIQMGDNVDPLFINKLLATNFEMMQEQGQRMMESFAKDVPNMSGLMNSFASNFKKDPLVMPDIAKHIGIKSLAQLLIHVAMMGIYKVLHAVVSPILNPIVNTFKSVQKKFQWKRRMDAWKYGSGSDFELPKSPPLSHQYW